MKNWVFFGGVLVGTVVLGLVVSPGTRSEGDRFLVTRKLDASERHEIVVIESGSEEEVLTDDFWSAGTPSLSFDGERLVFAAREEDGGGSGVWEMGIDGSGARLVTAGNGAATSPAYLPNGRIVYSDAPAPASDARALFSVAPDGIDQRRLTYGTHRDVDPILLPDGKVRFTRILEGVDVGYPSVPLTIRPLGEGVARFNGHRVVPPEEDLSGLPGSETYLSAAAIAARRAPPVLTSVVNPAVGTGILLCLDVYTSGVPSLRSAPGTVTEVAVAALPGGSPALDAVTPLGTAPVFEDGSFQLVVPANLPLALALLDSDGRELARLESGIWVRPNETRGCIGCHENPNLSPANLLPLAVTEDPVTMSVDPLTSGGGE